MSSEDFPALPGTQIGDGSSLQQSGMNHSLGNSSMGGLGGGGLDGSSGHIDGKGSHHHSGGAAGVGMDLQTESVSIHDKAFKRGVQTSPDGEFH